MKDVMEKRPTREREREKMMNNLILTASLITNLCLMYHVSSPLLIYYIFPTACTFHSTSEYPLSDADAGKFVRIREDSQIGDVVFAIDAYPRSVEKSFRTQPQRKPSRPRELDETMMKINNEPIRNWSSMEAVKKKSKKWKLKFSPTTSKVKFPILITFSFFSLSSL